jgi:hypothetical protein
VLAMFRGPRETRRRPLSAARRSLRKAGAGRPPVKMKKCFCRLLKKAHLSASGGLARLGARCVVRRAHHERDASRAWTHLRWVPRPGYPSGRMGDSAWHLGRFEHPEENRVFQQPAKASPLTLHAARSLPVLCTASLLCSLRLCARLWQRSAVSSQRSAISGQRSPVSDQLSAISGQHSTEAGHDRRVASGSTVLAHVPPQVDR